MLERRAIVRDRRGRYAIDYDKMPVAMSELTKELLEIEATGDRLRGEKWFARYDQMANDLRAALKVITDIPVDIDPVFSFARNVK